MSTYLPLSADPTAFARSGTLRALREAALDEMHAHRFYLRAARLLEEKHLFVIAHAFRFTAAQEQEHADVFRGLIRAYGGSPLPATEDNSPLPDDPGALLQTAAAAEQDAADCLYPRSARTAMAEGYPRIAEAFTRVADTERHHARRFRQYADALTTGTLFRDETQVTWLCLPCGQFTTGTEPPRQCSACGRDQGHFIRSSYHPFVVEG